LKEQDIQMSELDKHYRKDGEEHQRRAIRLKMNWYQGNITKYAERAPHKGCQNDDLLKVLDYATMWLESPDKEINPVLLTEEQRRKISMIASRLLSMGSVVGQLSKADFGVQRGANAVMAKPGVEATKEEIDSMEPVRTIEGWSKAYGRMPTPLEVAQNNLKRQPYESADRND
jgi:hypothetical protein